jgi:hypothetical protein
LWYPLVNTPLARRTAEVFARAAGRRHLAALDRTDIVRAQNRILLGLIHAARGTAFGKDHDFPRIRSTADFRRLVPVQTLE